MVVEALHVLLRELPADTQTEATEQNAIFVYMPSRQLNDRAASELA